MKFIHCADIHLDSPLSSVVDGKKRRAELFEALVNVVEYAENNGVKAVVIAGDLFDDKPSSSTVSSVATLFNSHAEITFLVLCGNHGERESYCNLQQKCNANSKFFGETWSSVQIDDAVFWAKEVGNEWTDPEVDRQATNVFVLHGDVDNDGYGVIDKKAVERLQPFYCALGHIHAHREMKWGKTQVVYCGALEARGFDESEPTGFVVVDTSSKQFKFVRQAIRTVEKVEVSVDVDTQFALTNALEKALEGVSPRNYVNLVVKGTVGSDVNVERATEAVKDRFFAFRYEDHTRLDVDLQALAKETSLRGRFVKLALEQNCEDVEQVIAIGLKALAGEDVD